MAFLIIFMEILFNGLDIFDIKVMFYCNTYKGKILIFTVVSRPADKPTDRPTSGLQLLRYCSTLLSSLCPRKCKKVFILPHNMFIVGIKLHYVEEYKQKNVTLWKF